MSSSSSSTSLCKKPLTMQLAVNMEAIGSQKLIFSSSTTGFVGPAGLIKIHLNERYEKQKRWWTKQGIILDKTLIEEKVTRSNEAMTVLGELHIFLVKEYCQHIVSKVLSALGLDDQRLYPLSLYESLKNRISEYVVNEATHCVIDRKIKTLAVVVNVDIVRIDEVDDEADLVVVVRSRTVNNNSKGVVRRVYEKERLEKNKGEHCGFCGLLMGDEDEEVKVVRMPCSHVLHVNCLARQMKVHYTCPVPGCGEVIG